MPRKPLLRQLYPPYLLILCLALLAMAWYSVAAMRAFHRQQLSSELETRALLLAAQAEPLLASHDLARLATFGRETDRLAAMRQTIVAPSGLVLADSEEEPLKMGNHAGRPEIRAALAGQTGSSLRYSYTLQMEMLYVAIPIRGADHALRGVLRLAMPLRAIDQQLHKILGHLILGGALVALLAGAISLWAARRVIQPLATIKSGANRFAAGEFAHQIPTTGSAEMADLAEAINRMASQLESRLASESGQRHELEAVFASLVEGVLAVDREERILRVNQAGARMLAVDRASCPGKAILAVVRNLDLQKFIHRALHSREVVETELYLRDSGAGERYLQVHGVQLRDQSGTSIGSLIALHDITRLRRLEEMRRDFVANVSHELKTPLTAIKGAAETLLHDELADPEIIRRFLEIMVRQADRLDRITADLLTLSRLESEDKTQKIFREEHRLDALLREAVQLCAPKAAAKEIPIELQCPPELTVALNPPLIEQVLVNLLDNAIKYSPAGRPIQIVAAQEKEEATIRVLDHGVGIGREHLPRLFERFYRVDKARSRKLGGTGLGLAIAKHIVLAHGGQIEVVSQPGQGSTFTVRLPRQG